MKRALVCVLLVGTAAMAGAFDFGVVVSNTAGVDGSLGEDLAVSEALGASLWFNLPFTDDVFLAGQGSYAFTLERPVYVNPDYLEFSLTEPLAPEGAFTMSYGRLPFADSTGYVYSDTADGARFGLVTPFLNVNLFAAYTGLTFGASSSILVSRRDLEHRLDPGRIFSPPRLVAGLSVGFPSIIEGQLLTIGSVAQFDLHDPANLVTEGQTVEVEGGGPVNTVYPSLSVAGSIAPGLFYDAFFVANFGSMLTYRQGQYRNASILGFLSGGGVEWFPGAEVQPRVAASAVFATGDPDSDSFLEGNSNEQATAFVPLTGASFGSIISPRLHNIFVGAVDLSIKPFAPIGTTVAENVTVSLSNFVYVKPTGGAVSIQGLAADLGPAYLGFETNLGITARITSDLGLALRSGLFFPSAEAFGSTTPRYEAELDVVLSF